MVSYKPLWHTLIDRDMKKMELVERVGMSRATLSKLNNDHYVALEVLDRICEVLDLSLIHISFFMFCNLFRYFLTKAGGILK